MNHIILCSSNVFAHATFFIHKILKDPKIKLKDMHMKRSGQSFTELTSCNAGIFEQQTIIQLVKKYPAQSSKA
jgi:hypothetical protein